MIRVHIYIDEKNAQVMRHARSCLLLSMHAFTYMHRWKHTRAHTLAPESLPRYQYYLNQNQNSR